MLRVLITAFEPFDRWSENSSWLALMELTRSLPESPKVVTRRYPVDFAKAKERLSEDLAADYDFALHLGQSSQISRIELEAIGLNIGGEPGNRQISSSRSSAARPSRTRPRYRWGGGRQRCGKAEFPPRFRITRELIFVTPYSISRIISRPKCG